MWKIIRNKRENVKYNGTIRRVHATIVAMEEQKLLHILSVCVFAAL
jgi:hypothetical protein